MGENSPVARMRLIFSVGSAFALLFLLLSGIALYVSPQCRVAESIRWSFLGLSKDSWEVMHIFFALVFAIMSLIHLWLNWRVFTGYVFRDRGVTTRPGGLFVAVGIIAILLFVLSAFELPPAAWVHELREKIKHSWSDGASPVYGPRGGGMHSREPGRLRGR